MRKQIAPQAEDGAISERNGSAPGAGILRPGSGYLRLPDALAEAGETEADDSSASGPLSWLPGPVVLTITALAVLFISIIAWFVSQMPDQ